MLNTLKILLHNKLIKSRQQTLEAKCNFAKSLKLGYPSQKMDLSFEQLFRMKTRYSLEPTQLTANNLYFKEFNLNMHYFKIAVDVTQRILRILQLVDILWMISHQWDWIFNTTTKDIWITAEVQVERTWT